MCGDIMNLLYVVTSFANPDVDSLWVCLQMADITVFQGDLMMCFLITDNFHITNTTVSMAPPAI
jgi:hypothetical protein